jgi:hypothetical protein
MCNCGKVIAPKKNTIPKRPISQKAAARKNLAQAAAKKRAIAARKRSLILKKK